MQYLLAILTLVYILSPIDLIPGIPADDIIAAIGAAAYLWKHRKKGISDKEEITE